MKSLKIMAKTQVSNRVGRPSGPKKKALNIYIEVERLDNLRELAANQQRNISTLVVNALFKTYGI